MATKRIRGCGKWKRSKTGLERKCGHVEMEVLHLGTKRYWWGLYPSPSEKWSQSGYESSAKDAKKAAEKALIWYNKVAR